MNKRQKIEDYSGEGDNNNNKKMIILPIIQKQIINYLFNEIKLLLKQEYDDIIIDDDEIKSNKFLKYETPLLFKQEFGNIASIKIKQIFRNYALVNKYWFNHSQITIIEFYKYSYKCNEKEKDNNNNNKFNLINKSLINKIRIYFIDIKNELINEIKSIFKSLESIQIYSRSSNYIGNLISNLIYLNSLENLENIKVDFNLDINHIECESLIGDQEDEENEDNNIKFTFKTNKIKILYDDCNFQYPYIYKLIKLLNPKKLEFYSYSGVSGCEHHLQQFHSISKLNQNYESVCIARNYIPLYSLYRFLQSPNLNTFQFNLQYHFISKLYNDDDGQGTEGVDENVNRILFNNLNFNEMDKFEFKNFGQELMGSVEIESNFENGKITSYTINEDDQKYCSFNGNDEFNESIPKYSRSLWNECMKLLTNNKTITNLLIGCQDCLNCDWDQETTLYNINFLNDFMDMFANNNTITSLTLTFNSGGGSRNSISNENKDLIFSLIASMLDRNNTLQKLSINYFDKEIDLNEIKKQTKNNNCHIEIFSPYD